MKKYFIILIPVILGLSIILGAGYLVNNAATVPETKENSTAPDFEVRDINGNILTLDSYTGKPVVIYFFATWCPYCHKDFEALKKVYPKYSDKINVLAISLDLNEDSNKIQSYVNKNGYQWTFAPGNKDVLTKYNVIYTTLKFGIDKNGVVLYRGNGVLDEENWEKLLDGVINSA